jgi:hypothetical protein
MDLGLRGMQPGFICFYREPLDRARLGRAMARVLIDFPMFGGRLISERAELRIEHAGPGIPLEYEESDDSIEELEAAARAGRTRRFDPQDSQTRVSFGRAPIFGARLTAARGGSALAVSWNHALGDVQSVILFMRAWALAYEGSSHEKPVLVLDRDAYLRQHMPDPSGARSGVSLASWRQIAASAYALSRPAKRIALEYSWEQLTAIHDALSAAERTTINDTLCAHIYQVLRRLSGAIETTNLCTAVNYRKRVGIPENVLGNLVAFLAQPVDELDDAAKIATGLRTRLEQYATKYVSYHASMRVFDAHPRPSERARIFSRSFIPGRGDLLLTNHSKFGHYQLMFGTRGPSMFIPLGVSRMPAWFMVVYELPKQAGLGVGVGLPPAVADRLRSSEGQALLSRGDAAWTPVQRYVSAA